MAKHSIFTFFCLLGITVYDVCGYCNNTFNPAQCAFDVVCENQRFDVNNEIFYYRFENDNGYIDIYHCEPSKMDFDYNAGYFNQWEYYPIHLIYKIDTSLNTYSQYEDNFPIADNSIPLRSDNVHMRAIKDLVTLLDLSGNNYDAIPVIEKLQSLAVLKLSRNSLETPKLSNKFNLESLVEIDLSHNNIKYIQHDETENVFRLLKKIDLSYNHLTKIIEYSFDPFNQLVTLDVSHNFIDTLSQITFEGMKQLVHLNISHNRIFDINSSLFRFNDLKLLDLSNNKITALKTKDFNELNNLITLNLNENSLKIIEKDSFRDMALLSSLYLNNNQLENLDKEIFTNNSNIVDIDLSVNHFKVLPKGLFKEKNINKFSITENKLEGSLQKGSFDGLNSVTKLDLSGQNLQSIEDYAFSGLNSLIELLLKGNNIKKLTSKCFRSNIKALKLLDLSFNKIENVDFEKDDLYNLFSLSLRKNRLTSVNHESFEGLNSLQFLDLSDNIITQVDSNSFKSLKELVNFEISNNPLSGTLEDSTFEGLNSLPSLDISCTLLSNIQNSSFTGMVQLKNLNISHSKIETLDYNVFTHTGAIKIIDLSFNKLKEFNINGTELGNLDILYLNNNMIKTLDSSTLRSISMLRKLILGYNLIESIDSKTFVHQTDLRLLDVSYNTNLKINLSLLSEANHILYDLNLSGVKTGFIFANIKDVLLSQLTISNSSIADVKTLQMNELRNLVTLVLSDNNISKLEVGEFDNINSLRNLDVSCNKITHVQPGVFKDNSMLLTLNMSHNSITSISYGIFQGLVHLETLDISYNEISDLKNERFYEVTSLRVLIADHNKIKMIDAETFLGTRLTQLSIGENPIPCDVLANLDRKNLPFQITATNINKKINENVNGIICNKQDYKVDILNNIGSPNSSENVKVLLNIRDILLNHFKNQVSNPSTAKSIIDNTLLTNITSQIKKSTLDINEILLNFSNSSLQIAGKNNETNVLLNKILNVLTLKSVTKAPVTVTKDNATYENLLIYVNKIKQDLDENMQLEKVSMLNEIETRISSIDSRLNSIKTPKEAPMQEKLSASGDTKSFMFTETCVGLILVILVGFVLFKVYKSGIFVRQRFSVSTRELPGSMDSAL